MGQEAWVGAWVAYTSTAKAHTRPRALPEPHKTQPQTLRGMSALPPPPPTKNRTHHGSPTRHSEAPPHGSQRPPTPFEGCGAETSVGHSQDSCLRPGSVRKASQLEVAHGRHFGGALMWDPVSTTTTGPDNSHGPQGFYSTTSDTDPPKGHEQFQQHNDASEPETGTAATRPTPTRTAKDARLNGGTHTPLGLQGPTLGPFPPLGRLRRLAQNTELDPPGPTTQCKHSPHSTPPPHGGTRLTPPLLPSNAQLTTREMVPLRQRERREATPPHTHDPSTSGQ